MLEEFSVVQFSVFRFHYFIELASRPCQGSGVFQIPISIPVSEDWAGRC